MIIYGRGPGQLPRYIARVLYDFSYWSFINLMYLEIIFGLICESFGFLQSKLTSLNFDKKNICLVCSMNRAVVSSLVTSSKKLKMDSNSTLK
jgi:hypothetical protein